MPQDRSGRRAAKRKKSTAFRRGPFPCRSRGSLELSIVLTTLLAGLLPALMLAALVRVVLLVLRVRLANIVHRSSFFSKGFAQPREVTPARPCPFLTKPWSD
jgi:hypothetical protein